jgi:hypothetical protein
MKFEKLVETKKRLKQELLDCRANINECARAAVINFETFGPHTADELLRILGMLRAGQELVWDGFPYHAHRFPAEELIKIYELVRTNVLFKNTIDLPLVPDIIPLCAMSEEQLVVIADNISAWGLTVLLHCEHAPVGPRLPLLKKAILLHKREVRKDSRQAGKRTKL